MKNLQKKYIIGGIGGAVIGLCLIIFFIIQANANSASKVFDSYIASLQKGNYEKMYEYVDTSLNKQDFVKRVKNIYEGIGMKNMVVEIQEDTSTKDDTTQIAYKASMDSIAGNITFDHKVTIVKNKDGYKLKWDASQIFPQMSDTSFIRVNTLVGSRGVIMDRNGTMLATQGTAYNVGFVAGSMKDEKASIQALAQALDISEESIQKKLNASWVKKDLFVPIKMISGQEKNNLYDTLKKIDGISVQGITQRVYPYGEVCAHLTGYVQSISAEELKKHKDEGYDEQSMIGKSGLEQVYEKELKAEDGYEIRIVDENEKTIAELARKETKNGKDIKTTIDINAQQIVYDQLKEDAGAGVMLDSHSGEVLAMVSLPSFDPNAFVLGISEAQWKSYNNAETTPLLNRVTSTYSPGSTFKAITGAIGLDHKTITPQSEFKKTEKWQKDASWGNNYVTTTQAYQEPSNLEYALKYSDNIYFAQLADQIGTKAYQTYLDKIGFNQKFNFPLSVVTSTYGKIDSDQKLAATGYGQGELQISPLHLSALYTAYKNEGTILQPYLQYEEGKTKVLKKQAYSKESADIIFTDLQKTMDYFGDNPTHAAGKTGTAQILHGEKEIGWLCAINDKISLTLMIDNTKELGESHYVIPKVQNILVTY